jgi:hypothetical protein
MSTPPTPPPPQPKRTPLAPIVASLIVLIIVAFGVCAANFRLEGDSPPIVNVAMVVQMASIAGLIAVAVIALVRRGNPQ